MPLHPDLEEFLRRQAGGGGYSEWGYTPSDASRQGISAGIAATDPNTLDVIKKAQIAGLDATGQLPPAPPPATEENTPEIPGLQSLPPDPMALSSQPNASFAPPVAPPPKPVVPLKQKLMGAINGASRNPALDEAFAKAQEVPQTTSEEPQDRVSNKNVAAAQNALSGAVDESDVAKAMERPHPPQSRAEYYAAMQQMAEGFGQMSLVPTGHEGDYYKRLGDLEGEKQKTYQGDLQDWRSKTTELLKEKFKAKEDAQKAASEEKKLAVQEKTNSLKEQDLENWRKTQDTNTDLQRQQQLEIAKMRLNAPHINLNIGRLTDQFNENKLQAAVKALPDAGELGAINDVMAIVNKGQAPGTGFMLNKAGWTQFAKSPEGIAFQHKIWQAYAPEIHELYGSNVTEGEGLMKAALLGNGEWDDPASVINGLKTLQQAKQDKIDRVVKAQRPEVQDMLKERGVIPDISGKSGRALPTVKPEDVQSEGANGAFNPPTGSTVDKIGDTLHGWLDKLKGGSSDASSKVQDYVKKRFGGSTSATAVQNAKAMQDDEEYRAQLREQLGLA